jgi:hypothetical protein
MNDTMKNTWVINGLLAVILVLLGGYYFNQPEQLAHAGTGWDTDGIIAMSTDPAENLVLIDTKKQNMMVYRSTAQKFRLIGARSYKYDVEIEDTENSPIAKGNGATYIDMMNLYNAKTK